MKACILEGAPCTYPEIKKGIGEFFFEQAEKFGERVFQIDGDTGKQETYHDVNRRSTRVAIYLRSIGVKAKDRVLICCLNNLDNIIPIFASLYNGAYSASVDVKQSVAEVKDALIQLEPKVIFVEINSLDLINKSVQETNQKPLIIVIGDSLGRYPNMWDIEKDGTEESNFRPLKVNSSDTATILFSSGTTSTPKGICISHYSILNSVQSMIQHNAFKAGVFTHLITFIWASAWITTAMTIVTASSKVIAPTMSGKQFLQLVEKFRITHLMSLITFSYQITDLDEATAKKYDTSSLYAMAIAGSVADPKQILNLRKYLPHTNVNLGYGSSEINYLTSHNYSNKKAAEEKVLSSGTLLPGVQMKVVDVDTGNILGPNQQGEIRAKSKSLMVGYYKLNKPDILDEDGFFKVGDIGYYDDEGYIYVIDRATEMFKYQGYQLSPALLEQTILEHPAVQTAVVFGVPHNVDVNHPAACVILRSGASPTVDELIDFVNSRVSDKYHLRGGLAIVKSIPLTSSGKYQRRLVRENFLKMNNKGN